jgi:hypothetical protein
MIFNFKTVDQNNVFYIGRFTIKYNTTTYIDVETLSVDQLNELQEIVASGVVACTNQTLDTVLTTIKSAIRSKSANIVVDQIQIPGPKGNDGLDGEKGEKGDPGLGIPEGGVAGDILVKKSSIPFDTDFFPLKALFPLSNHVNIKLEFDSNTYISRAIIVNSSLRTLDESDIMITGYNTIAINHGLEEFPKIITFFSKWTDGNYYYKVPTFSSAAFSAHSSPDMNVLTISGITGSNVGIIPSGDCFIEIVF